MVSYCVPDMFPLDRDVRDKISCYELLLPLLYFSGGSICTLHHFMMVLPMLFL